ncbi:MAG: hypothetical protein K5917_06315 [Clostridiales bacterium]|nr:hypothetical protein [Clostridiales bacterium]
MERKISALFGLFFAVICVSCSSWNDPPVSNVVASSVLNDDIVMLKTIVVGTDFTEAEKTAIKSRFPLCDFATSSSAVNNSYKVVICDSTSGRIPEGSTANDANIILYELEHGDWSLWKDVITSKTKALSEDGELSAFEGSIAKFPYHFFGLNRAIDSEFFVRYIEKDKWQTFYDNVYRDITPDYSSAGSDFVSEVVYDPVSGLDETDNSEADVFQSELKDMTDEEKLSALFRQASHWVLNNQKKLYAQTLSSSVSKSVQNSSTKTYDISKICSEYNDNVSASYDLTQRVRKIGPGWRPDSIDGHGSWSIQFSYKPIWVTNSTSNGLYYFVKANISVCNNDAYKGRWWNKHHGSYVRLTGYYLDNFIATFKPTAKYNNTEYDVYFPATCEPSPTTQSKSITYNNGFKWGLDGTLEGGYAQKDGGSGSLKIGGRFEFSENTSYVINDVNILNNRGFDVRDGKNVHYVSYKLQLRNLPQYKYSEYRGFTEGCDACKSTVEFNTCWLWYIPGNFTKDNMPTLTVDICGKPTYGAMSWLTGSVDLKKHSFTNGTYSEKKTFRKPKV